MAVNGGGVAMRDGAVINGAGGQIVATGELTEKRKVFVRALVANGCNRTDAARTAGYANPETEGSRLWADDAVRAAYYEAQECADLDLCGYSVAGLKKLAEAATTPPAVVKDCLLALGARGDKAAERLLARMSRDTGRVRIPSDASPKVAEIMAQLREGQSITLRSDAQPSTIDAQAIDIPYVNA